MFYNVQSFILTFLAEWGDRSQIATIAVRKFPFPHSSSLLMFLQFLVCLLSGSSSDIAIIVLFFCLLQISTSRKSKLD